jgi:hypothetical protein
MHKLAFTILALIMLFAQPSQAQDLKDIFRDVLSEYAEQKAEAHGLDLNGSKAKNVSLTFAGAKPVQSDVFESLHTASREPTPTRTTPTRINTPESDCFNKVQGRIAWNSSGSRQWSAGNIKKLCAGTRVASAPPQCFSDTMFKPNLWGKKPSHEMNWALASQLCAGTNSASSPINCLKGQLRRNLSMKNAINACDSDPDTRVVIANNRSPIKRPPVVRLPTKKLEEKACYQYVQGRIAWDAAGKNRRWADSNLKRLCKGTTSKYAAGNCVSYAIHKGVSWGKKSSHKMTWQKALDLCEGTDNTQKVTACFKSAIASGKNVNSAVRQCS